MAGASNRNARPGILKRARERMCGHRWLRLILADPNGRTRAALYGSLALNLLYAVAHGISAVLYRTHWFALFAVYYAALAVMRFLLARYMGRHPIGQSPAGELRRARLCACILLAVSVALSGAVLMMVYFGRGFEYRGVMIYMMAMYTFYVTVAAIVDLVKCRKYHSPILSAKRAVRLSAALVSMLALETAMLSQFGGDMAPEDKQIMTVATGAGVCAAITALALYTIIRTTREIRSLNRYGSSGK